MSDYTIMQLRGKCKGMMQMKTKKLHMMVHTALMAALVCGATAVIRIPSPTGGYVNAGDGMVLLCAWLLGPWYGGAAAGIGSFLTDLLMGSPLYAPGSLVIKGLDALAAGLLFRTLGQSRKAQLLSGLAGELIMTAGYFGYTALLLQKGLGAALSIPGNLVQGCVGLVIGMVLLHALEKAAISDNHFDRKEVLHHGRYHS